MRVRHGMLMEVRGQFCRIDSLQPLLGFWDETHGVRGKEEEGPVTDTPWRMLENFSCP